MSFKFSRHDIEEADDEFGLLDKGWYKAVIDRAEFKDTKKKTSGEAKKGLMLAIGYKLAGNEALDGRYVWANLNIENDNPAAVEIGTDQLNKLLHATGIEEFESPDQLLERTVSIYVKVRKGTNGYEDSNEVSMVKSPKGDVDTKGFSF